MKCGWPPEIGKLVLVSVLIDFKRVGVGRARIAASSSSIICQARNGLRASAAPLYRKSFRAAISIRRKAAVKNDMRQRRRGV